MMLAYSSVPFLVTILFIVGVRAADDKRNFLAHTDDRNTTVPLVERRLEAAVDDDVKVETANKAVEHCAAGTKKIYHDAIYATCSDTAGAEVDDNGNGCDYYMWIPGYLCGIFNTDSFPSEEMCCRCGGGSVTSPTAPTLMSAMEDAIAGIISSQDPLQCMSSLNETDPNPIPCTYDYNETDSNFEEVCTSNAVQGQVVVPNFQIACYTDGYDSRIYYFFRAPLCLANDCKTPEKCSGKPDSEEYFRCLLLNYDDYDDEEWYLLNALSLTAAAIESYMNNITGIKDCTFALDPLQFNLNEWFTASPGCTVTSDRWERTFDMCFSAGTTTSHNGTILMTFITSAVFVAMMTLLF